MLLISFIYTTFRVHICCLHFPLVVHVSKFKTHARFDSPPPHRQYFLDFMVFFGHFYKDKGWRRPTLTPRVLALHPWGNLRSATATHSLRKNWQGNSLQTFNCSSFHSWIYCHEIYSFYRFN